MKFQQRNINNENHMEFKSQKILFLKLKFHNLGSRTEWKRWEGSQQLSQAQWFTSVTPATQKIREKGLIQCNSSKPGEFRKISSKL